MITRGNGDNGNRRLSQEVTNQNEATGSRVEHPRSSPLALVTASRFRDDARLGETVNTAALSRSSRRISGRTHCELEQREGQSCSVASRIGAPLPLEQARFMKGDPSRRPACGY